MLLLVLLLVLLVLLLVLLLLLLLLLLGMGRVLLEVWELLKVREVGRCWRRISWGRRRPLPTRVGTSGRRISRPRPHEHVQVELRRGHPQLEIF